MRVGIGYDTHRLEEGRPLILGGVRVAHPRGLRGHSDADVVLHAIIDALLGAAGMGDIGDAFADTDPAHKNQDSRVFLTNTLKRLKDAGWRLVNVDATIIAQEPKLGPAKLLIRQRLMELLGLPPDAINLKAKTGEGVGHIGRAEAIGCQAVALIEKDGAAPEPLAVVHQAVAPIEKNGAGESHAPVKKKTAKPAAPAVEKEDAPAPAKTPRKGKKKA